MKKLLILSAIAFTFPMFAGDVVIYPTGIVTNNLIPNANCPGDFRWHATYARSVANGWGWKPDTNNFTTFSASITNRSDTHVQSFGFSTGHFECGTNSLQFSNPTTDIKYRFNVYGTNNPPATTNDLPLRLHNFLP